MQSMKKMPLILGTIAALGFAQNSMATTTYHTIGGDHCQPGSLSVNLSSGLAYFQHAWGYIYANSGAGAYTNTDCAMPREVYNSTLSAAWVDIKRANTSTQQYNIVSTYFVPGGSILQSSKQQTSSTAGNVELYFDLSGLQTWAWGYYQMNANLGNGDQLYGVQYGEVTTP